MGQQKSGPDSSNGYRVEHSVWIRRLGVRVPLTSRHFFLSLKRWHFHKNTRSCVENECCYPRTISISNVNFTLKICMVNAYPVKRATKLCTTFGKNHLNSSHLFLTIYGKSTWLIDTSPVSGDNYLQAIRPTMPMFSFLITWPKR